MEISKELLNKLIISGYSSIIFIIVEIFRNQNNDYELVRFILFMTFSFVSMGYPTSKKDLGVKLHRTIFGSFVYYFAANALSDDSEDSDDDPYINRIIKLAIRTMVYFLILVGIMYLPEE